LEHAANAFRASQEAHEKSERAAAHELKKP
jgi:hypothetical protein